MGLAAAAALIVATESGALAMPKCRGSLAACCNWINSEASFDKRIEHDGEIVNCSEIIEVDDPYDPCGRIMSCLPGDWDGFDWEGAGWNDGYQPPTVEPLDMCLYCDEQGAKCVAEATGFETLCIKRMRDFARNHCENTKTDCLGHMIDDFTSEAFRDEHGKVIGTWVHGPGIDKCVNDCMVGIPDYSEEYTSTGSITIPSYFGAKESQSITVHYGGRIGIFQACFDAGHQMLFACSSGEFECLSKNSCPLPQVIDPATPLLPATDATSTPPPMRSERARAAATTLIVRGIL